MAINFEILKLSPKQLFVQVRYYRDGEPDYIKNFITEKFDNESLCDLIQSHVSQVEAHWAKIAAAPEEDNISVSMSGVVKPIEYAQRPSLSATEKVIPRKTELEDKTLIEYDVVPLSAEEMVQWRNMTSVTNRQARLALAQQGLLGQVNAAIAAMEEPDKSLVETEWEYAAVVERSSPWVIQLGSALGLDEEVLDELFKAAAEL